MTKIERKIWVDRAKKEAKELDTLLNDWNGIMRKHGYGDSEIDRVWQGLIYASTLNIPVAIPSTKEGWKLWDSENAEDFIKDASENVGAIIKIVGFYRYWGMWPTEKMNERLKKELWRFVD